MKYIDYVKDEKGNPVVNITHNEAEIKCRALGGRLPYMWEAYAFKSMEEESTPNIWEWTQLDSYGNNIRGGSWDDDARVVRVSCRGWIQPDYRYVVIGFRCIREEGMVPSIDSKKLVDEIIAADGYYGDDPRVIIIVQYITQMGTTCYYLCYKWDDLVYTANVAEPKILWIANAGRLGQ